jgi:methyl-accepting chemotaxis protein
MLTWFRESAPIESKLSVIFGLQACSLGICCGAALLVTLHQLAPLAAFEASVLVFWGAFVLGMVLRHAVVEPYAATVVRMEALAEGDLTSPVRFTSYHDCVGRLTKAMQKFRENAQARTKLEAAAAAFQQELDRKLKDTEAAFVAAGLEQKRVVEALAAALAGLAKGDLTVRMTQEVAAAYQLLQTDFNGALATLQETLQAIAQNTQGVRTGAGEVTQAADDLSRRTEQQAASLEETAAALDEITAAVHKTAEGAIEARNVVNTAKQDAERPGEVVRETVRAMTGIETSSKQIGNIIGVIDEIAFQTNLLALNVGVEAARAGDAGRGFAVVATEVRALAQRSADAAKEIKTLISASGAQVETGVKLVSETGKALARIVEQVNRLNTLVTDIAGSAQEQATGLGEINTAINQMDQVTQQNAAMVGEATAASHGLANEAEELARLIGQFRIGQVEPPQISPPRRPAAAVRPLRKTGPSTSGKFVAIAGGGRPARHGLAAAAAPNSHPGAAPDSSAAEDWNEF